MGHARPQPVGLTGMKRSSWRWYLGLLVAVFLVACDQAGEAERKVASAEQSRQVGQLKVAANLYHRAADLREGHFDTLYQAALLDLQVDNLDEAEGHLRKVLSLRPDFGPPHLNLGVVFVQRGQRAEGRKELLEALRFDPRLTRAYYSLAVLELDDGRLEEAEAGFPAGHRDEPRPSALLCAAWKCICEATEVFCCSACP
jgi:tetratricopeptide (TPR) repeat protein